jgi:hypothetical protein
MPRISSRHVAGCAALFAAGAGIIGFGFLIAALVAPTPSPTTLRRYADLFRWQDAGVLLQALAMVPVVLDLRRDRLQYTPGSIDKVRMLGLVGQSALALVLILRFANVTSDMTYMLPQGVVGLWIIAVSQASTVGPSRLLVATGWAAGVGLLVVALGFIIYGALVAPTALLRPLSTAEIDAQALTTPNIIAHICLAIGTLLGRALYPLWTLVLAVSILKIAPTHRLRDGD